MFIRGSPFLYPRIWESGQPLTKASGSPEVWPFFGPLRLSFVGNFVGNFVHPEKTRQSSGKARSETSNLQASGNCGLPKTGDEKTLRPSAIERQQQTRQDVIQDQDQHESVHHGLRNAAPDAAWPANGGQSLVTRDHTRHEGEQHRLQ